MFSSSKRAVQFVREIISPINFFFEKETESKFGADSHILLKVEEDKWETNVHLGPPPDKDLTAANVRLISIDHLKACLTIDLWGQ